jgi:hypothetical protein
MRNSKLLFVWAWVIATAVCGQAARADWPKFWPTSTKTPPKLKESKYPAPAKIAVIWSPAVLNRSGQQSVRGFGGRIYFYSSKNEPVPVEGQLVVYAYNDAIGDGQNRAADRKFAFTPEQFTQHYAPTELGASYSVWIPWDAIGGPQAQVSLIPIFTSATGQLIIGESSHNLLPGPTAPSGEVRYSHSMLPPSPLIRPDPNAKADSYGGVQQASFQQANQHAQQANQHMSASFASQAQQPVGPSTLSIDLPGSMADRLAAAPSQIGPMERLAIQRASLNASRAAANEGQQTPQQYMAANTKGPAATLPPGNASVPPPVRYGPPSPQAPIGQAPQPTVGLLPSAPFPGGQPSGLPLAR